MGNMGFYGQPEWSGPGGPFPNTCFKRKNRWLFVIPSISADGVNSLPPLKSGKLSFDFKEMQAEHLNETIFFPSKPEWKPIQLTLYDIQKNFENPIFSWIRTAYDPKNCSRWVPCLGGSTGGGTAPSPSLKVAQCFINMLDGCGNLLEQWVLEDAWPQTVEFSDGDMASSELVTCDLTLRYDRAYILSPANTSPISYSTTLPSYTCSVTPIASMVAFAPVVPMAEFISIR